MFYTQKFKDVLQLNTFIGTGNPNSKILIIGKEISTDEEKGKNKDLEKQNLIYFNKNCEDWKKNLKQHIKQVDIPNWECGNKENNPIYAFKGLQIKDIKSAGHTWRKYQKLNNYIFDKGENKSINFQENFFITEMSVLSSKTTRSAQKKKDFKFKLQERKNSFFKSDFIQSFPVVILACSNYINGEEIESIFDVKFDKQYGQPRQKYWTHLNAKKDKLVIYTRQLSANVTNNLIIGIANEVKAFLK